jgi:hypothetical protein
VTLTFSCVTCNQTQFSVSAYNIENGEVPIVTFGCPRCGAYTAVTKRAGGGILIAPDKHGTEQATEPTTPASPSRG